MQKKKYEEVLNGKEAKEIGYKGSFLCTFFCFLHFLLPNFDFLYIQTLDHPQWTVNPVNLVDSQLLYHSTRDRIGKVLTKSLASDRIHSLSNTLSRPSSLAHET